MDLHAFSTHVQYATGLPPIWGSMIQNVKQLCVNSMENSHGLR